MASNEESSVVLLPTKPISTRISDPKIDHSNEMPAVKRHHDGAEKEKYVNASPFMPMFEVFRDELDEHHDRRERIIKASRDITAASKKM